MSAPQIVDRRSGQVYTQTMMAPAVGFANGPSWVHESPFLNVDYEDRSPVGAPTLRHLTTKQTLRDQRNLNASLFANVPWPIANHLWDYLRRSGKRTMYMWKLLATAYPQEISEASPFCNMVVDRPKLPVRDYLSLVKDDACIWYLSLSVCTEYAWTPELVSIANTKNIVALEVSSPSGQYLARIEENGKEVVTLNDRIVRTWSELVQTSGAFKHLQILKLSGQRTLSTVVFEYLSSFPSLLVCVTTKCDGITSRPALSHAQTYGWDLVTEKEPWEIHKRPFASYCWESSLDWNDDTLANSLTFPGQKTIPLLDLKIGRYKGSGDCNKMIFRRRKVDGNSIADIEAKKRKNTTVAAGDGGIGQKKRVKKSVMKNSRAKDLSGMLAEFS